MSIAVFFIGFGGPTKKEEIRPFLDNVLSGHPVPPARYEEVAAQYEQLGGSSPFNSLTYALSGLVQKNLARAGYHVPFYVGMRHADPFIGDAMRKMADDGIKSAVGVVLTNFVTEASWNRYLSAVRQSQEALGRRAPEVKYAAVWYKEPLFIQAVSSRIQEALEPLPEERRKKCPWIFTAHSIPASMDASSRYSQQITLAAKFVAKPLNHEPWSVAYQSRSGRPEDAWLVPDVGDAIRAYAAKGARDVLVVPIGFLIDHMEVLFDLDVKARAAAREAGVNFIRAKTVGTHPDFVELVSDRISDVLDRLRPSPSKN